jgi:hypothetical protein
MQPHTDRILHAITFLIGEAAKRGLQVTQYDLVKTLFLGDRAHLNKYGRPITYDNYVAMTNGPVPSQAYDLLKENPLVMKAVGLRSLPWTRTPAPEISEKAYVYSAAQIEPSDEILSPSDFEELSSGLTTVKSLTFTQIRKLTHEDAAYVDAWEDEGGRAQYPMSYSLLFDVPDEDTAKHVAFASKHV